MLISHRLLIPITAILLAGCHQQPLIISAPAGSRITMIQRDGVTVIPNGRLITPLGRSMEVAPHPFGLAISSDGSIAVTANSGTDPLSITILRDLLSENPEIQQVPPGPDTDKGVIESVFMGLAISPDNKVVYVAGGQSSKIYIFDIQTGARLDSIECASKNDQFDYSHGYIGDMVLTTDGTTLYAVDQINFRVIIIDTATRNVRHSVPVGRYPFGITLSPDEQKVYVANVGMFEYGRIKGADPDNLKETGLKFPASAYQSEQSHDGYKIGNLEIPPLGDPNAPESFSVWTIDVSQPNSPIVTARTKTGRLIGEMVEGIPAVGGSSPNSLAASDNYIFVSNGNNDNISVIDIALDTVVATIPIKLGNGLDHLRGIIPFGVAVAPDGKRLYVAESGINAIGVVDIARMKLIGHIPTGWFPAKLAVTPNNKKLIIANAKGYGSGPNGGATYVEEPVGTYIGSLMRGTVTVLDIPNDSELPKLTQQVMDNNFLVRPADDPIFAKRKTNPIPLYPGQKVSPIKHIIFVSKENRTYDEVFGQIVKGNGDPTLARYGYRASFSNRKGDSSVENATVMPNHLALARQFAISDNFYVDADVSADGHRWLVNTYPNEWVEATTAANYGGNRSYRSNSNAPGNLGLNGSAGAIYPEDYNEAGSMWEHLQRHGIVFYNFGFGIMFEPGSYSKDYKYTGIRHIANYPVPAPIYERTSKTFPTYNMAIPDQFRVDMFIEEFNERWRGKGKTLPSMLTVILPNDHGAGDRPDAGFPYRESYMADNDLAVGRLVEFLTHTDYWKDMVIVITEDDAQNGVDHIDAHRSILMVISPWARRGYVSYSHSSFGSIFKTFWNVLGIPYLNQYDATATDLADIFTDSPNYQPYNAVPVDPRVFDPQKALDPFDENFNWKALDDSPAIDNPTDMARESREQAKDRREKSGKNQ